MYELRTLDDSSALYFRVLNTVAEPDAKLVNKVLLDRLVADGLTRMLADYRDMETSDFDARITRNILTHMDALIVQDDRFPPGGLRIAILSREATFGHGIARMTLGNAYALRALRLMHFVDWDAAYGWLEADT